jgi:hypothetical protein
VVIACVWSEVIMLTPEAKQLLSTTIPALRKHLRRTLRDEAERRYRLSVDIKKAGLDEVHRKRRERLEAWLEERVLATQPKKASKKDLAALRQRHLDDAVKEAAATFLNRIVLLRHLEALGLSRPAVVTGGWNSKGYREFRGFAPALAGDETEGFAALLQVVFDELAMDLPGLFGDVGLTRLFAIPAATLREVLERLDDPRLASAWTDDTTLGWVYQYWNDPERASLDAKIKGGGKIEPHEIASKTQMFTERYMVEWLLHNSLGVTWLRMCKKKGWTADAEAVLPVLDTRRTEWRKKREAGDVALDALMPIKSEPEELWKYYVPQPIPENAVEKAPNSVREIKILDPACGSGHFLIIAFDLLLALYREEARHTGIQISDKEIAESILENNLFGIDIDPRAIQIAAAGLYLKARTLARDVALRQVNLVAPVLQLGNLPKDDSALVQFRRDLKNEAGIAEKLTDRIVSALTGVDYLGSLLKIDTAVEDEIQTFMREYERTSSQGDLFTRKASAQQVKLSFVDAKAAVLEKLEQFLAKHSCSEDLGLRLHGEQLAAGVRFMRIAREGAYDIVVGNPPYHGIGKLADANYYMSAYSEARSDIFAGFFVRALELLRPSGCCAFISLSNWMFLSAFREFRKTIRVNRLALLADLGKADFTTGGTLISTACAVIHTSSADDSLSIALRPHEPEEVIRDDGQPARTQAALLLQRGRYEFNLREFAMIEGEPLSVYWWDSTFLKRYAEAPKFGDNSPARKGLCTGDDTRFMRFWWEVLPSSILQARIFAPMSPESSPWVPTVKGGKDRAWFEPMVDILRYEAAGLEVRVFEQVSAGVAIRNPDYYFVAGVAFSMVGSKFRARAHRYRSVFGNKGSSVFPDDVASATCAMNMTAARSVLQSLNPGIGFEVGDVNRLPVFSIEGASDIYRTLEQAFGQHEAVRESSIEFKCPGPSPWRYAQDWAQLAIDRPVGKPLPPYAPVCDEPAPEAHISFALGVALGRFGAHGEGILDTAPDTALPHGIIFLSAAHHKDDLDHPACAPLLEAWETYRHAAAPGQVDLGDYLRRSFFSGVHIQKRMYDKRPIYFPLSSAKKNFVAYVSIHRWQDDTLQVLLADHLLPEKRRMEGEFEDLRRARAEKGSRGKAEKRYATVQKLLEELGDFIDKVIQVAEAGPPPPDDKTPPREVDTRFVMDLDDGVMVNSAALWPLLEPQWKDPKKWWKVLATASGGKNKDYDWSHLAARYFPERVARKCHDDPSLAVAHKCFWRLHPAKAYAWELRLQDEIRPDFTIDEPGSDEVRARFLADHADEAASIRAAENKRRERKASKAAGATPSLPFMDQADEDDGDA